METVKNAQSEVLMGAQIQTYTILRGKQKMKQQGSESQQTRDMSTKPRSLMNHGPKILALHLQFDLLYVDIGKHGSGQMPVRSYVLPDPTTINIQKSSYILKISLVFHRYTDKIQVICSLHRITNIFGQDHKPDLLATLTRMLITIVYLLVSPAPVKPRW